MISFDFNSIASSDSSFLSHQNFQSSHVQIQESPTPDELKLVRLYNYKNPFSFSKDISTDISFFLNSHPSRILTFTFYFYNIFGEIIERFSLTSNDFVSSVDAPPAHLFNDSDRYYYYSYSLTLNNFQGRSLSPGVYFYLIKVSDHVLGRGRMAVLP
ncbi:MAG: hypothetical protein VW378_01285 [bacterium]